MHSILKLLHLELNIDIKNDFYNISNIINDMKVRSNCIINNFCALDSMANCHIFRSQCYILYGCQLWNLESKQLVGKNAVGLF